MNAQCGFKKWAVTVNVAMLITVLRHWERGDRTSHGPALALITAYRCQGTKGCTESIGLTEMLF